MVDSLIFFKRRGLDRSQQFLVLISHFFSFCTMNVKNAGFRQCFEGFYHFLKKEERKSECIHSHLSVSNATCRRLSGRKEGA